MDNNEGQCVEQIINGMYVKLIDVIHITENYFSCFVLINLYLSKCIE